MTDIAVLEYGNLKCAPKVGNNFWDALFFFGNLW